MEFPATFIAEVNRQSTDAMVGRHECEQMADMHKSYPCLLEHE